LVAAALVLRLVYECGAATVTIKQALKRPRGQRAAGPDAARAIDAPAVVDALEPLPLGASLD
jgi:hypothetical protein